MPDPLDGMKKTKILLTEQQLPSGAWRDNGVNL